MINCYSFCSTSHISSCLIPQNSLKSCPFYDWRNRGSERLSHLTKITPPAICRAEVQTQAAQFQSLIPRTLERQRSDSLTSLFMVPFHHPSCIFNLFHFSGPILCQEFPSHPLPPAPPREILPVLLGLDHISPAKAFLSYLLDGIAPSTAFPHFSYISVKCLLCPRPFHQTFYIHYLYISISTYYYFPYFIAEKSKVQKGKL